MLHKDTKLMIFSDIDGSFLNHDNYSYGNLYSFITKLKKISDIIFVSSKTFAEIKLLNNSLGITFPFIVENGACIFFPESYYNTELKGDKFFKKGNYIGYRVSEKQIKSHKRYLNQFKKKFNFLFYSELSSEKLANITNLKGLQIKSSQDRLFSDPIYWNDSKKNFIKFENELKKINIRINKGGRFIHLSNDYDKGDAVGEFLKIDNKQNTSKKMTISIGDSQNDVSMLELTDYSCMIKREKKKSLVLEKKKNNYYSFNIAPDGWSESLEFILNKENINF